MVAHLFDFMRNTWSTPLDEEHVLTADDLEAPRNNMEDASIVFRKGASVYGTFRVDRVLMQFEREHCLRLGLVIVAMLVHGTAEVQIALTNPRSDIRRIVLRPEPSLSDRGIIERVVAFLFRPKRYGRSPWCPRPSYLLPIDLPFASLANRENEIPVSDDDWRGRDTLFGFGGPCGCAQIALLLLNAAGPLNEEEEFLLAQEPGPAGVAPGSAELQLILPGSVLYAVDPSTRE
jgi:hypothetical protein